MEWSGSALETDTYIEVVDGEDELAEASLDGVLLLPLSGYIPFARQH